jgi:hypothetical protein
MSETMTIQCRFHIDTRARGRKQLNAGEPPIPACEPGRVPRVARRLALAHRFEGLLHEGVVQGYAELARLSQVTPARVSQVMALLNLASDIQEQLLFLPRTVRGRDPIQMYDLLPLTTVLDWKVQRRLWAPLLGRTRRDENRPPGRLRRW